MISCKEIGPPHWGSLLDEGSCPALTCRWGPSFQPHACNPPFIACRILDAAPRMPVPSTYHCVEVHTVDCSMCPEPIPQARLDVAPHVLTCSPGCAVKRAVWRGRAGAKRARQRQKEARAAAKALREGQSSVNRQDLWASRRQGH